MTNYYQANAARAERRAARRLAPANRLRRFALQPSMPAQAGIEPRSSFPSGDRTTCSLAEGLQ